MNVSLVGASNRTVNESHGLVQLCVEVEGDFERSFTILLETIPITATGKLLAKTLPKRFLAMISE